MISTSRRAHYREQAIPIRIAGDKMYLAGVRDMTPPKRRTSRLAIGAGGFVLGVAFALVFCYAATR